MERFLNNFPIQQIDSKNPSFPKALKNLTGMPEVLYYRGNYKLLNEKCFAIVGTRRPTDYGKSVALSFSNGLAKSGLTIVSGLALGIDSLAHQCAIDKNALTIAVLGSGLDEQCFYPAENLKLAKQILEKNGCLISEYPAGTKGALYTFPQRNRIIAGLSVGVLVVEAKIKSGALITANYAKQYKKPVFAIPNSIYSEISKGCNFLIKNGARLVESPNEILEMLGINQPAKTQSLFTSPQEKIIADILQNGPLHIDAIIEKTKMPSQTISGIICIMELENKIKNLGGNTYAINYR
ncbi:MAG: DNA-processing protein DprA [bacterium]|nr:DNA-processing protein DprA [bacterium]